MHVHVCMCMSVHIDVYTVLRLNFHEPSWIRIDRKILHNFIPNPFPNPFQNCVRNRIEIVFLNILVAPFMYTYVYMFAYIYIYIYAYIYIYILCCMWRVVESFLRVYMSTYRLCRHTKQLNQAAWENQIPKHASKGGVHVCIYVCMRVHGCKYTCQIPLSPSRQTGRLLFFARFVCSLRQHCIFFCMLCLIGAVICISWLCNCDYQPL